MIKKMDDRKIGRISTTKKIEELQKTDEQTEKSHRQGQEGITSQNMRRDHGISKNRAS